MMTITTTYATTFKGIRLVYTETRIAYNKRDAHMMIMYAWQGVDKIEFLEDIIEF